MSRRRFIGAVAASGAALLAGCLSVGERRGTTTTSLDSTQVTTTGGDEVEVLLAQVVIREADDGPRIHYRLWNAGSGDATVEVRTVLRIEDGDAYEATGYADVPAGGEVVLEYRVVEYDALTGVERENVRRGNADFDVYVNGEPRPDA